MTTGSSAVVRLADAATLPVAVVGGKASTLARLAVAGFPVPPGLVITSAAWERPRSELATAVTAALDSAAFAGAYAVRSSAVAEDLPGASYAGQYESLLDVPKGEVVDAIYRCRLAVESNRVEAYRAARGRGGGVAAAGWGMAVLVQPMVPARAAGVAFTANPLTGDRHESVVTAVRGLGERLVSGAASGDEWSIRDGAATSRRCTEDAISAAQAIAVADLALRVRARLGGEQDIEWALDPDPAGEELVLLQARPMTALPEPVGWAAPGPGLWMRNFRLGEWLPEPLTPLFADWLLPLIEEGYLQGMRASIGAVVPFRYATVNGWYFNAAPVPTPRLLLSALAQSRGRIVRVLFNALVQVSRNPAGADRAVLGQLYRTWREVELPAYRRLVDAAQTQLPDADHDGLLAMVDRVGTAAGRQLWFLAIVGGSAWKMEGRLARFAKKHLPGLSGENGPLADGIQVLLGGLPGIEARMPAHAVFSADWYWPTGAILTAAEATTDPAGPGRRQRLAEQRQTAEAACLEALSPTPRLVREFAALLEVTRRYTLIREEQARSLTLGWPVLRSCALRLGQARTQTGTLQHAEQVFFLTRDALNQPAPRAVIAEERRSLWQRQRRLLAPLTLGKPPRLIGDPVARAIEAARGPRTIAAGAIIGQPASTGRATGPVRLITDPAEFSTFQPGEVLLARATAPAWTPLFGLAVAVVTDGGALAAHASIVAREYGIPAVVGTGDATHRLLPGQWVTVDGTTGTVTLAHPVLS